MQPYLIQGLKATPLIVQRLITAMGASDYDRALNQDRFTPREVIAHLAEWEPILRERFRTAIETPGGRVEAYDEGQMAIDNRYCDKDIFEEAGKFRDEREKTITYVGSFTQEDLQKTMVHPERGELTALDLALSLLGHDLYHIEQLSEYLAEKVVPTW
jgi:hypothetical protein